MRDFMEFYDGALQQECDFLLFVDADTFVLDGNWASSKFEAFKDPDVAAISFVPRTGAPAIFVLLCRIEAYRALPSPVFACRYEFPDIWPHGINLQPGDFAVRELRKRGKTIVNVDEEESSKHIAMFRSTTGIRSTREYMTRAAGNRVFQRFVAENSDYLAAAYDNFLLGSLYRRLFGGTFAPDLSGIDLGGSLTVPELQQALKKLRDPEQARKLRDRFRQSEQSLFKLAIREGIELPIPSV